MFQFSGFALLQLVFNKLGFPIRKSADHVIFANPRSLSQLITSFIASESQGIPRVPFLTFFYLCRLLLGTVCLFLFWLPFSSKYIVSSSKTEASFPFLFFLVS